MLFRGSTQPDSSPRRGSRSHPRHSDRSPGCSPSVPRTVRPSSSPLKPLSAALASRKRFSLWFQSRPLRRPVRLKGLPSHALTWLPSCSSPWLCSRVTRLCNHHRHLILGYLQDLPTSVANGSHRPHPQSLLPQPWATVHRTVLSGHFLRSRITQHVACRDLASFTEHSIFKARPYCPCVFRSFYG